MISIHDVYTVLCSYENCRGYSADDLLGCCENALCWVRANLKPGVSEDNPLIAMTAAAIANFDFYLKRQTDMDNYESYKVGDMTVSRDGEKEMRLALERRSLAIATAHSILQDGGFYCCGK